MVSTRSSSTRADSASPPSPPPSVRPKRSSKPPSSSSSSRRTARGPPAAAAAVSAASASSRWSHTPTAVTLAWMAVSLPLVVWDTGYVLGRPHTMEGGSLHWPLWAPYKLYGEVDYMYGWRAYQARNGFTAAQGLVNVVETLMYLFYLWAWWTAARGRAAEARRRRRLGAFAALVGFSAAVMTLSKTLLYCALLALPRRVRSPTC